MSKKTMLFAISFYQYLMLILVSVLVLLVPVIEPHQYFDSLFVDVLARSVLWLYFVGSYWSIANIIKNKINKRKDPILQMHKNNVSFALFGVRATATGAFLFFLTRWSLIAFAPHLSNELIFVISLGNSVIYAMLILSLYYFLPVE